MEGDLDSKKFKNLDDLVNGDVTRGISNYSCGILEESAGLLVENSTIIQRSPFRDLLLVNKKALEKRKSGTYDFLLGLKSISLEYLNNIISREIYIFDEDDYSVSTIAPELESGTALYRWKKKGLKDREIDMIENPAPEGSEIAAERLGHAKTLYGMAESALLAYNIKSSAKLLFNYDDGDSGNLPTVYIFDNSDKLLGKNILDFDERELERLRKGMGKGRLFVNDRKNGIYSLESTNGSLQFKKHADDGDQESIIISLIKNKWDNAIYD